MATDFVAQSLRWTRHLAASLLLAIGLAGAAHAQALNLKDGVALKGHDPVAYFTENRPVAGSRDFVHAWNGAEWRFASAANRDAFAREPEKYAPQYGGFCAYAAANGYRFDIEPEAFRVENGRLYLNANKSVQSRWLRDIPGYIAKADEAWPRLNAAK